MTNKYTIQYLPIAQNDLEEIFKYIQKDNKASAEKLLEKINEKISNLISFPLIGTVPKDERLQKMGYRMLIIDKYIVFYAIIENIIEIRRVLHGSRNYNFLL